MPTPIPASLASLLLAIKGQLSATTGLPVTLIRIVARDNTPRFLGDRDILLRAGPVSWDQGFEVGSGRVSPIIRRPLFVHVRTRTGLDMSDADDIRMTDPQLGHIPLEEAVYNTLLDYMPMDVGGNVLVQEPMHPLEFPPEEGGEGTARDWIESRLAFQLTYQPPVNVLLSTVVPFIQQGAGGGGADTDNFVLAVNGITPNVTIAAGNATSVTNGSSTITIASPTFGASGGGHSPGSVPDPGGSAGTTRFLCENSTWAVPAGGGGGGVPSVDGITSAVTLTAGNAITVTDNSPSAGDITIACPVFVASGAGHSTGAVPDPGSSAGTSHYLREDATWAVPPGTGVPSVDGITSAVTFVAGTSITVTNNSPVAGDITIASPVFGASGGSHSTGSVPDPGSSAGTTHYLREDATWTIPSGTFTVDSITGAVTLTAGTSITITDNSPTAGHITIASPTFVASGAGHAVGSVPDPGSTAGTTHFLREDATWAIPAGTFTVDSITGSVTLTAGNAITITDNSPSAGDITIASPVFGASGGSHSSGSVPDPGSSAGTTRFLREDATWVAPSGGGGGMTNPMTTLGDIIYENATPVPARLAGNTSATNQFLTQTGTGSVSAAPAWNTIQTSDLPAGTAANAFTTYSGTSTSSFVQLFSVTNSNGLHGTFSIKNTGGTNSLTVKMAVTDASGANPTAITQNVSTGRTLTVSLDYAMYVYSANPTSNLSMAAPLTPWTNLTVSVEDQTSGSHTTYSAYLGLVG